MCQWGWSDNPECRCEIELAGVSLGSTHSAEMTGITVEQHGLVELLNRCPVH